VENDFWTIGRPTRRYIRPQLSRDQVFSGLGQ
jgi:hypothetical protein